MRGNHENYLLKELPVHDHNDTSKPKLPKEIIDLFRWNHDQIIENSIEFLESLPSEEIVEVEGTKIYVSHYPQNKDGSYRQFYHNPNVAQCEEIFANIDADVFLYGHTHVRNTDRTEDKLYINPGSVGCPIGTDSASAGILEITKDTISYEQLDITYDIASVVDEMLGYSDQLPAISYTVQRFYRED